VNDCACTTCPDCDGRDDRCVRCFGIGVRKVCSAHKLAVDRAIANVRTSRQKEIGLLVARCRAIAKAERAFSVFAPPVLYDQVADEIERLAEAVRQWEAEETK
jgi:hypothetical protein